MGAAKLEPEKAGRLQPAELRPGDQTADRTESKMVAAIRLVLAASGLLVIYIDPSQPDRYVELTYLTLSLYTVYSALICLAVLRELYFGERLHDWLHWVDVLWYVVLVALSSGTNSIFFIFFVFAIVVGSFRKGFATGLGLSVASSALFTLVGVLTAPSEPAFELTRFMYRPLSLFTIGYLLARWGGWRIGLERRLRLLKDLSGMSNPRFGVDRTIGLNLEKIRAFYGARCCLYVIPGWESRPGLLYRAREGNPEAGCRAEDLPEDTLLASDFSGSEPQISVGRTDRLFKSSGLFSGGHNGQRPEISSARLARLLGARFFATVPVRFRLQTSGQLYLARDNKAFVHADSTFLLQVVDQMAPVLENIQLVDRLASTAAEEERRRIARDIHDSVIQPYVGLQLGLVSVEQKLSQLLDEECSLEQARPTLAALRSRITKLVALTDTGVAQLRGVVGQLNHRGESQGALETAVRRFASKFAEATGIVARVEAEQLPELNDRLAAEVFQMAAEGLSNIRRHTHSPSALIQLRRSRDSLVLRIENEGGADQTGAEFTPRSITERARSLQGKAFVERVGNRGSAVVVEIPL